MRYFTHIVTDHERIVDVDGTTFVDLAAAEAEASQSARDLMAEELRCGRPVPLGWRVQIADARGTIVLTIKFASLVFETNLLAVRTPRNSAVDAMLIERAKATFARVRNSQSEINRGLTQLKDQLRVLAEFNAAIGSRSS